MRACLLKPPFVGGFRRWLEPVFRQLADRSADAAGYGIRAMAPAACSWGLGLGAWGLGPGVSLRERALGVVRITPTARSERAFPPRPPIVVAFIRGMRSQLLAMTERQESLMERQGAPQKRPGALGERQGALRERQGAPEPCPGRPQARQGAPEPCPGRPQDASGSHQLHGDPLATA